MAHLNSDYASFETFLTDFADKYYTVDLTALNNSTVFGTAIVAVDLDDPDGPYVNVSISAQNLTPGEGHAQHIHGLFDDDGNPIDSKTPGIALDSDLDGFVEVLEGVASYGDIILTLDDENDSFKTANADGSLSFIQSYNFQNTDDFISPVSGVQYSGEDLLPLSLREIVLHGLVVPNGEGAGTDGEVDGGVNGYTGILPAAAGELSEVDLAEALDVLEDQRGDAAQAISGGAGDNRLAGDLGDDALFGGGGNDTIIGARGDDVIGGGTGNDVIAASAGDDVIYGADGNDQIFAASGADLVFGGSGNDVIYLGNSEDGTAGDGSQDVYASTADNGDDIVFGFENGTDLLDLTGSGFESFADVAGQISEDADGNATIDLNNGDVLTLSGVSQDDLDASDFQF